MLNFNTVQKRVYLKVFKQFSQLEKAIQFAKNQGIFLTNLTIVKRLSLMYLLDSKAGVLELEKLKFQCERIVRVPIKSGIIISQEFGTIFIAGKLTPMFLYEVKGKPIGEMSTGIYGVLRGLGVTQANLDLQLDAFKRDSFMLIVREEESLLINFEGSLRNLQEESSF